MVCRAIPCQWPVSARLTASTSSLEAPNFSLSVRDSCCGATPPPTVGRSFVVACPTGWRESGLNFHRSSPFSVMVVRGPRLKGRFCDHDQLMRTGIPIPESTPQKLHARQQRKEDEGWMIVKVGSKDGTDRDHSQHPEGLDSQSTLVWVQEWTSN